VKKRNTQQQHSQATGKLVLYLEESTAPTEQNGNLQSWRRLPKSGGKLEGLSRSKLNQLILPCEANGFRPPVKSISVRKPGAIRGVRLIFMPSLFSYLDSLANEQCGGGVNGEDGGKA
jgi:hypothetical protein